MRNQTGYRESAMRATQIKYFIAAICIALVVFMLVQCSTTEKPAEPKKYASLDPAVTYVGMNTCRGCHQDIYDTYIETGMGKSFDLASKTKSSAHFDNKNTIYDKYKDFWYRAFWEGDSLRVMEYRLSGNDTVHKRIETVSYIVGSGQHTNSHIINTNGYLNQAPMTFYTQKGHWDLPPGFENGGNTRFDRLIGLECMTCHNSYPVFEEGSENKYEVVEQGIGCERCHGPGSAHVADKRTGKLVDITTQIDYSIVNPAKLPIDLQLDVCQRCHIQGNAVLNEGKSFFDFRPGMRLSEVMHVFMPVFSGHTEEHIMASHAERLKMSACFTESVRRVDKQKTEVLKPYRNALTCVTCHNPHVSSRKEGAEHFNNACRNCHSPGKDPLCTEKQEPRLKVADNCIKCHMPSSGTTDIPHVSVHDHRIAIPVDEPQMDAIRKFAGIACINEPDVSNEVRARAFLAYFEKFNFGKEALDSARQYLEANTNKSVHKNFHDLVRLAFLENDFNEVIALESQYGNPLGDLKSKSFDNRDAWTAYRIGESFTYTGNGAKALSYFERAHQLAPFYSQFTNKYATSLASANRMAEAIEILKTSLASYPKHAASHSNLGYLLLTTKRDTASARMHYEKALSLDPDYEQAVINMAGLFILTNKESEALKLIRAYLKRHPDSSKAIEIQKLLTAS